MMGEVKEFRLSHELSFNFVQMPKKRKIISSIYDMDFHPKYIRTTPFTQKRFVEKLKLHTGYLKRAKTVLKEDIIRFDLDEMKRDQFYMSTLLGEPHFLRITEEGILEVYTVEEL